MVVVVVIGTEFAVVVVRLANGGEEEEGEEGPGESAECGSGVSIQQSSKFPSFIRSKN